MSLKDMIGEESVQELAEVQQDQNGLQQWHYQHCREEGMTDEQIEEDWKIFERDYAAFSNITFAGE